MDALLSERIYSLSAQIGNLITRLDARKSKADNLEKMVTLNTALLLLREGVYTAEESKNLREEIRTAMPAAEMQKKIRNMSR